MTSLSEKDISTLIRLGETERVEFKYQLTLSEATQKGEFIKDIMALANAHGKENRVLIIGVHEHQPAQDISALNLNDAMLHQLVDAHIEPRIDFVYRGVRVGGVTLGLLEIQPTEERFHVLKKSIQLRGNASRIREIEPGHIWIRRGSANTPISAADFRLLRESIVREHVSQPKINVLFANGKREVTIGADWVGRAGGYQDLSRPKVKVMPSPYLYTIPISPGALPLSFIVENLSTEEAKNVSVAIIPPAGCQVGTVRRDPPSSDPIELFTFRASNIIHYQIPSLLRLPVHRPEDKYITVPEADTSYVLNWKATAGNMLYNRTGELIVTVKPKDHAADKSFPVSLAESLYGL